MGTLCSVCFQPKEESYAERKSSNERTPLLSEPKSARHGSSAAGNSREVEVEPEHYYKPITLNVVGIEEIDKQFKDHVSLYNEYLTKWNLLNETLEKLVKSFNRPNSSLVETLRVLKIKLAGAKINIRRKYQFCMEIQYDIHDVEEDLSDVIDIFNKANHLTKDILDKGPMLSQSVDLVLKNEERGKRDILVFAADDKNKSRGPEMLKSYMNNYMELKKVPSTLSAIKKRSIKHFEDLKNAAQSLLVDGDITI